MANNKRTFDHVGSAHVFRERPPQKNDNGWIGGLIVFVIIALVVSQCSG